MKNKQHQKLVWCRGFLDCSKLLGHCSSMFRSFSWTGSVIALCATFMVAGCGAVLDQFSAPPSSTSPSAAQPAPPDSPHKPPVSQPVKPQPAKPAPPELSPTELSGRDEASVLTLLGPATATRLQGSARVLVWKTATCTFDVILFADVKDGSWRVLSWDTEGSTPIPACYEMLRGNR